MHDPRLDSDNPAALDEFYPHLHGIREEVEYPEVQGISSRDGDFSSTITTGIPFTFHRTGTLPLKFFIPLRRTTR